MYVPNPSPVGGGVPWFTRARRGQSNEREQDYKISTLIERVLDRTVLFRYHPPTTSFPHVLCVLLMVVAAEPAAFLMAAEPVVVVPLATEVAVAVANKTVAKKSLSIFEGLFLIEFA